MFNKFSFHSREQEEEITREEEPPKKLQEKLAVFKDIFPDNICAIGGKRAYSGNTGSLSYEIQVSPHLKDTWHELPVVDNSGESEVSNWSERAEKEGLPKLGLKGPVNVVPKDLSGSVPKEMLPYGVRVSFSKEDKAYETFLSGPSLVKDSKMIIEGPFVQGPTSIRVKADKNVVRSEIFARHGLRESEGVTSMLELLSDRLKEVAKRGSSEDLASELKLTHEWVDIVLLSSFRTSAYLQSIQVMTKDSLREEALDNLTGFGGSLETKKNLRHSHYATPKVFGPLSAQFEQFVLPSSLTHRSYKLFPKSKASGTSNQRDRAGLSNISLGSDNYKRPANSQWNSPGYKKFKRSDNFVKSISAQEALKRLRGNSGKQNQFFRDNQQKGKKHYQNTKRR